MYIFCYIKEVKDEPKKDSKADIVVKSEGPRIRLDRYNSELHVEFSDDDLVAGNMKGDGFEYMWGGARATHGVCSGKVLVYFPLI